jgi:hypothetical protein
LSNLSDSQAMCETPPHPGWKVRVENDSGPVRLTLAFQLRLLMIAPAAVGCKRLLGG